MIYLKRIFPNNLYSAKGINVKTASGKKEYNLSSTSILSVPPTNKLYLKIDYHKAEVDIIGSKIEAFYVVNLKPEDNSILFFLKILFKNSLEVRKVSEEEFNNYTPQMIYANQIPFELNQKNSLIILFGSILSLFFLLYPLNFDQLSAEVSSMSFWFGALSFMGFVSLFFLRKISERQLYFRFGVYLVASIILGGFIFLAP